MAIFGSKFKCGRTTPQLSGHPFAEGADPPTPITASNAQSYHASASTFVSSQPPSAYQRVPCAQIQIPTTSPLKGKSIASASPHVTPTKLQKSVTGGSPSSSSRSRQSPVKRGTPVTTTTVTGPPPLLPPPSYALPPTPEASPQGVDSTIGEVVQKGIHSRRPSLRMNLNASSQPPLQYSSVRKHLRTESGTPSNIPTNACRGRSASVSNYTSPFQIITMDGPYPSNLASPIVPNGILEVNALQSAVRIGTHDIKHRPAALKLKTSNLDRQADSSRKLRMKNLPVLDNPNYDRMNNSPEINSGPIKSSALFNTQPSAPLVSSDEKAQVNGSDPVRPTQSPRQSEETIRPVAPPERADRPRSFSTNDALNITELDKKRGVEDTPRKQRSQPTFNAPQPPLSPTPTQNPNTPAPFSAISEMSVTPGSVYTSLPTTTSGIHSTVKPFDNLPIPWSTIPFSELLAEIGQASLNSLVEITLERFIALPPRLLPLNVLRMSITEENRLNSELSKLKGKHVTLINQRDSLMKKIENGLVKLDQSKVFKMIQVLSQLTRRIDRIARQIYICNDQIRQIEIQNQEHVIGCLRIALEKKNEVVKKLEEDVKSISNMKKEENSHRIRHEQDDTFHQVEHGNSEQNTPQSPIKSCHTTVRFLEPPISSPKSPTKMNEGMRISLCQSSRPMSTATIININSLSFPIPPDRKRYESSESSSTGSSPSLSSVETETEWQRSSEVPNGRLEVTVGENEEDIRSFDSHATALTITGPSNEILIYPPGHHRSCSAPIIGMEVPHSAYRSEDGHSSVDLSYQDNPTCGHERSVSESELYSPPSTASIKVTAPLNFKARSALVNGPVGKGTSRSQVRS